MQKLPVHRYDMPRTSFWRTAENLGQGIYTYVVYLYALPRNEEHYKQLTNLNDIF